MKKILLSLSILFSLAFSLATNAFAMSIGGMEFTMKDFALFVIVAVLISALLAIRRTKKITEKTHRTNQVLNQIVEKDASWNKEELKNNAQNAFYKVMSGLAYKEFEELKNTVHPDLYSKWEKQFEKFIDCKPENLLNNEVKEVTIVDIDNFLENEKDNYTVKIEYMASEYIVDKNGNLICDNYNEEDEQTALGQLTEYWKFEREGEDWLLIEANRSNKWKKYINDELVNEEE